MSRTSHPRVGISVICFRDERAEEVLLVQRGKAPALGLWAPPGGSIEWGETLHEAASREVREETGLDITLPLTYPLTAVDAISHDEQGNATFHFVLIEVIALAADATAAPLAADDAADCRWWPVAELADAQPQVRLLAEVVTLAQKQLCEMEESKDKNAGLAIS